MMTPGQIMDIQNSFLKSLHQHGAGIDFFGVMDIQRRWTRIRAAIVGNDLQKVLFHRKADGSVENYMDAFERVSGQSLEGIA